VSKRVGIEVSVAMAVAAKLANVDVIAAYPITPQTHIVEHLAKLVADGELDAEYIPVESEHSAMSACLGAAAAGARTFTATAGQGLELMHEVLYVASSMRFPIVMAVVNRAISAPLSVWGDHSDAMACRDTGWIQIFVENGQEVVDNTICAFKMAEHKDVLLPVMIHLDGFHLSHVIEPIIMPDEEKVNSFLPPNKYPMPLHPDKPVAMGDFGPPAIFTEAKKAQQEATDNSMKYILAVWQDFSKAFGRKYKPVETYKAEGAKTLLLTMGSYSETAMTAVDKMREEGQDIGLVRLRLWRPFPFKDFAAVVKDIDTLIVLDRSLSPGGPVGPVCSEVRSALYSLKKKPAIASIVAGLGGRDITIKDFENIVARGKELAVNGNDDMHEIYGVRESE
jgi:pyruvate ferredoxin oxidoreductase alpha subunit